MKICPKCGVEKELTEKNFYPARPRLGHKTQGWQSFCRDCWKGINKENKFKMAQLKAKSTNAASI